MNDRNGTAPAVDAAEAVGSVTASSSNDAEHTAVAQPTEARPSPTVTVTLGRGRTSNAGTPCSVELGDLPRVLAEHDGLEAWVIAGAFEAGVRTNRAWRFASAAVVDIDHKEKAVPTGAERGQLAAVAAKLGATLGHDTPHGKRLWFVLTEPCSDAARFDAAVKLLCDRVDAELVGTEFTVDRGASENCAQFMWTPNALVNGVQRQAEIVAGGAVFAVDDLLPVDWQPPEKPAPRAEREESVARGQRPFTDIETAVAAYREEHNLDVELQGGDFDSLSLRRTGLSCPICQHRDCASLGLDSPHQAFCFSSNHEKDGDGRGIKGARGYTFDIVDVHAHQAGLSRRAFLRREGWLDPAGVFEALPAGDGVPDLAPEPPPRPAGCNPLDVVNTWQTEGPLRHVATGFATLDALTNGGPTLGSLFVPLAPPDNCKTALGVQMVAERVAAGYVGGILAVDEDETGVVTRLLQRLGFDRLACELRTPETLAAAREALAGLRLRIYGPEVTIEAAAADLARYRDETPDAAGAVLFVDSLQTVKSSAEGDEGNAYRALTIRVQAAKAAAARHKLLVIATSEMNRGGYRSKNAGERVEDMAAGSGSGAIEYAAKLLVTLRQVEGDTDVVELRVAKSKFGPRHRADQKGIFLRLDRARQVLAEDAAYEPPAAGELVAAKEMADAAVVVEHLRAHPGIGVRALHDALRSRLHKDRIDRVRRAFPTAICETREGKTLKLSVVDENLPPALRLEQVFPVAGDSLDSTVPEPFQEHAESDPGTVPFRPLRGRNSGTVPAQAQGREAKHARNSRRGESKGGAA